MKKFAIYSLPLGLVMLLSGCGTSHANSNNVAKGFHFPLGSPLSKSLQRKLKEAMAPKPKWIQVGGTLSPVAGGSITGIAVAPNGTIYASTQQDLWTFEGNTWSPVSLPSSFGPNGMDSIERLGILNNGTLIAGTPVGGVFLDAAGKWSQPTQLELGSVQNIQVTPPNYVVVTTMNHNYEFNGSTWVNWHTYSSFFNGGLPGDGVVAPNGIGYLPTSTGLYQLALTGWTPVGGSTNPIASRNILGAGVSSAGSVIAYAVGLGAVQFNGGHWSLLGGPKHLSQASISYTPQGILIIAGSARIAEYQQNHWSIISTPQSLSIKQMAIMPDGGLVIATSNGVWAYTTQPSAFMSLTNTASPSSAPPSNSVSTAAAEQYDRWQKAGVPVQAFTSQLPPGSVITGLNGAESRASVLQNLKIDGVTWWILAFQQRTSATQYSQTLDTANDIALFRNSKLLWTFPIKKSEMTMQLEFSPIIPYPASKALQSITPDTLGVHFFNISLGASGGTWTNVTDHWMIKTNTMVSISSTTKTY